MNNDQDNVFTSTSSIFTEEDYNSGDGFLTAVWGPQLWFVLHTMSFNYPVSPTRETMNNYRDMLLSLRHTLPCKYCRDNLAKNLRELPPTNERMSSRDSFSRYIYDLHEHVNTMLGKKSGLTYEAVRERFEHFRARCSGKRGISRGKKVGGNKEKGCTEPLYGKKSKCIISIVPVNDKRDTLQINKSCLKKRRGRVHGRVHSRVGDKGEADKMNVSETYLKGGKTRRRRSRCRVHRHNKTRRR